MLLIMSVSREQLHSKLFFPEEPHWEEPFGHGKHGRDADNLTSFLILGQLEPSEVYIN